MEKHIINIQELEKVYGYGRNTLTVLNNISLNVQKGLIIAPAEEIYAVTTNDIVIPWDLQGCEPKA